MRKRLKGLLGLYLALAILLAMPGVALAASYDTAEQGPAQPVLTAGQVVSVNDWIYASTGASFLIRYGTGSFEQDSSKCADLFVGPAQPYTSIGKIYYNSTGESSGHQVKQTGSATQYTVSIEDNNDTYYATSDATVPTPVKIITLTPYTPPPAPTPTPVPRDETYFFMLRDVYKITYTDGLPGEELFPDESYRAHRGDPTPAYRGPIPYREGWEFAGWSPVLSPTVAGDTVYEALWVIPVTELPKTGQEPGAGLFVGLAMIVLGGMGLMAYRRKSAA